MFIGLTGGIGCGKSTVAKIFASFGAVVIDADVVARSLFREGTETRDYLDSAYGSAMLDELGEISRPFLAERIFTNEAERISLEQVIHPELAREVSRIRSEQDPSAVVVYDSALLVDKGLTGDCDVVVVVTAPYEDRVQRLINRGLAQPDIDNRIAAQVTDEERRAVADFIIVNDGSEDELRLRATQVWHDMTNSVETA